MGEFQPNINQIIACLLSVWREPLPAQTNICPIMSDCLHATHTHTHKKRHLKVHPRGKDCASAVINTSQGWCIQRSSHINKLPHVFTTLEITSVPIRTRSTKEEVHLPTQTYTPPTDRRAHTYTKWRNSTNLKYWENSLLEAL